jgi:LAO/AO transport system kinase
VSAPGSLATLLDAAKRGDRVALAKLLSAVENDEHGARELAAMTWSGPRAFTIGLTGAPGVGKSTLTDRLITETLARFVPDGATAAVAQVGVVCVDPTSPFSGGAILGDRIRMQDHALDDRVFIRSLASRGQLGGLSIAVPDAVAVLAAAGFALVLIETVGVGQVELDVASTADATVVVVTPGWGDATQAAKAGLLEIADVLVVNKADRPGTAEAVRDLRQMLDLGEPSRDGWRPPVLTTVATDGTGIGELFDALDALRAHLRGAGGEVRRRQQAAAIVRRLAAARVERRVDELARTDAFRAAVDAVAAGTMDPYAAAESLITP